MNLWHSLFLRDEVTHGHETKPPGLRVPAVFRDDFPVDATECAPICVSCLKCGFHGPFLFRLKGLS